MKGEKNIDNNIREKLENFQVSPPPHLWDNVQSKLVAARRRNRLVYAGWISAAAVVVIAFLAGWFFNENISVEESAGVSKEILKPETKNEVSVAQPTEVASLDKVSEEKSNIKSRQETTSRFAASSSISNEVEGNLDETKTVSYSRESFRLAKLESAEARVVQNEKLNIELAKSVGSVSAMKLNEQEQLLVAENIKNINVNTESENNWKMGMFVAPGYSSFNANHTDTYSQNMTNSGNTGNTNVGGGISVQYKTKKRWIFESGVYYAQNGQESENSLKYFANNREADYLFAPGDAPVEAPVFASNVRVENDNLAMNSTAGIIEFKSTPKGAALNGEFDALNSKEANVMVPEGQFSQVFDFMEIPLYVRYRVVDSKIGVELITGLNAGIVVGNNAYINNQYGLQNIGETKDISTVNLSGTLGLGLNYAMGKHFSVALEPRYSYYLNSINTNSSVDFRPYRIGFYTGVTYEF